MTYSFSRKLLQSMTPLHFCHGISRFPKYEYILPDGHCFLTQLVYQLTNGIISKLRCYCAQKHNFHSLIHTFSLYLYVMDVTDAFSLWSVPPWARDPNSIGSWIQMLEHAQLNIAAISGIESRQAGALTTAPHIRANPEWCILHIRDTGNRNPYDYKRTCMLIYVSWFRAHSHIYFVAAVGPTCRHASLYTIKHSNILSYKTVKIIFLIIF